MSAAERPDLPLGKKLAFSAALVVLGLLALEGVARLVVPPPTTPIQEEHERLITVLGLPALNDIMEFDPVLFWRLVPDLREFRVAGKIREHDVDFTVTTHASLRSPPASKAKKGFRVLALGDSCTFGVGVEDEETWPAQLSRLLRGGEVDAEVINAGVPGYTAFQGKRFLETRGLALEPDLVLVAFGFNDIDAEMPFSDAETARMLAMSRLEAALVRSRVAYGMKRLLDGALHRAKPAGGRPRLTEQEFYDTLEGIRALCDRAGADMLVVAWPYEAQVKERAPDFVHYQIPAARFCIEREVDGVNLVTAFLRAEGSLFIDHVHASAAGCRVAAEALLPWVKARAARRGARKPS